MSPLGDILVLGLGSSGVAAARYCAALDAGEVGTVTAVDAADTPRLRDLADELAGLGVRVALGADTVTGLYDLCIASPGIPPHAPLALAAAACSERMVSEIEFAFTRSRSPWVAVTGTNGKTTTTALVAHLLLGGGISARTVGNIGTPAIEAVDDADAQEVLVAEVSSFQLALTETFRPRAAALLNLTPDHIDWHGSFEAYAADKGRVFANMGPDDVAVIDVDDPGSAPFAEKVEASGARVVRVSRSETHAGGASAHGGELVLETRGGAVRLVCADELQIRGPHNVSNALAAAALAHALGVPAAALRSGLKSFAPIEHRLEPAGYACGAEWFNDSKATNPDAVLKALAAFGDRPLVLLLGGRNKGNDFEPLAQEAAGRARTVVAFGEAGAQIAAAFQSTGAEATLVATLADAVHAAAADAREGDAIVLSPACASFDEFANYEERGSEFKRIVSALGTGDAR